MQTREFSYMAEIARQHSLSGAARALGVSQPALSQFLSGLEDRLGFRLFFSWQKQLFPTEAGDVYLNAANQILAIKERTYRQIRACTDPGVSVPIRIGMVGGPFSARALGAAIPAVSGRFTGTEIITREAPIVKLKQWLRDKSIDAAVIGLDSEETWELPFYQFQEAELYVIVPRIYPLSAASPADLRHPEVLPLRELSDIPFIMTGDNRIQSRTVNRLFEQAGFSPVIAYRTDNQFAAAQLGAEGFGAFFALSHQLPSLDQARCRAFALPGRPRIRYGAALARQQPPAGALRELVKELILEQMKDMGELAVLNDASRRLLSESADGSGSSRRAGEYDGYQTD